MEEGWLPVTFERGAGAGGRGAGRGVGGGEGKGEPGATPYVHLGREGAGVCEKVGKLMLATRTVQHAHVLRRQEEKEEKEEEEEGLFRADAVNEERDRARRRRKVYGGRRGRAAAPNV